MTMRVAGLKKKNRKRKKRGVDEMQPLLGEDEIWEW